MTPQEFRERQLAQRYGMGADAYRRFRERERAASRAAEVARANATEWSRGPDNHVFDCEGMIQAAEPLAVSTPQQFLQQVEAQFFDSGVVVEPRRGTESPLQNRRAYVYHGAVTGRESRETRELLDGPDDAWAAQLQAYVMRDVMQRTGVPANLTVATEESRRAMKVEFADAQIKGLLEEYPELRERYTQIERKDVPENARRIIG